MDSRPKYNSMEFEEEEFDDSDWIETSDEDADEYFNNYFLDLEDW
jgi:hypothetical protein